MERAIIAILSTSPATSAADRIYPGELPQKPTFPAIVYHQIFDSSDYTHDGPDGVKRARFQIDCMAERYADAVALKAQALARLSGFKGNVEVGSPATTVRVQGVFHEGGSDDTASEMLNAGPRVRLKRFEVQCFFRG